MQKAQQRVDELWPLANMYFFALRAKQLPKNEKLAFCYDVLNRVSRSFAIVTQQLPQELRDSVCVFYLVLRALDTVEDDMSIAEDIKVPILKTFHEKIYQRGWSMHCGSGEYVRLMAKYPLVTDVFLSLPDAHQQVIADITRRMGKGMAEFIQRDVVTVADYDLYCHYVAGVVGIGLSQLFASSGLEAKEFSDMESLSNGMGLFLQKTNIIRDYLEDINEEPAPRMFWPKEIWGKYAAELADFKEPANAAEATAALNHMVTDALRHALSSLEYMSKLRNKEIFRFCAIPQVMAIATLAEVYNNHKVFTGVVKIRRGVTARYMIGTNNMTDLYRAFAKFSTAIIDRAESDAASDPNAALTLERANAVYQTCSGRLAQAKQPMVAGTDWLALTFRLSLLVLLVAWLVRSYSSGSLEQLTPLLHCITAPICLISGLLIISSAQRV